MLKILLVILFLFVGGTGLVFCGIAGYFMAQNARPHFWKKTDCTITSSSVFARKSRAHDYVFKVEYQYVYEGRSYSSAVYQPNHAATRYETPMRELVKKYPAGSRALCLVNPSNPNEAALAPGTLTPEPYMLFPFIVVAVGIVGLVKIWRRQES